MQLIRFLLSIRRTSFDNPFFCLFVVAWIGLTDIMYIVIFSCWLYLSVLLLCSYSIGDSFCGRQFVLWWSRFCILVFTVRSLRNNKMPKFTFSCRCIASVVSYSVATAVSQENQLCTAAEHLIFSAFHSLLSLLVKSSYVLLLCWTSSVAKLTIRV